MSHPFNAHRDHKIQHERVADIAKACGGRMAVGGAAHSDVAADKALVHKMVKKAALRATGGAVTARADRPSRAWGGRTGKKKSGGKGKHTVNVIVAPHPPAPPGLAPPGPGPTVPGVAAGPPPGAAMPPKPMMPPPPGPMGGPPGVPGMPPGVPPPIMPRKSGGAVFSGKTNPSFTTKGTPASVDGPGTTSQTAGAGKGRTPIGRGFNSNKQDTPNIGRGPVITKATGGPISSAAHGQMGPKFSGGARGGLARKQKADRMIGKGYGTPTRTAVNPTRDPSP